MLEVTKTQVMKDKLEANGMSREFVAAFRHELSEKGLAFLKVAQTTNS